MKNYFTIDELCHSEVATSRGIDNTPPKEVSEHLAVLITKLLNPLREAWGAPLHINSGYRCERLNMVVGGVAASQHLTGEAADITAGSYDANRRLFRLLARGDFEFDQLIDEAGYHWLHVSYSANGNRKRILHL